FYAIALISIALLGFNLLLRKNSDLADTNIDLIKWLIYLIFLYTFIDNFQAIFDTVFNWIQDLANYLGVQASHPGPNDAVAIKPENVFAIGVDIAKKMLTLNFKFNIFRVLLTALVSVISAATVLYCFAAIGLELLLVQIGSKIILAGGIFLLGFAALQWTRDYAERYIHSFFHLGIKMVFIYILIGIGLSLAQNWTDVLNRASVDNLIDTYMAVVMASYIYYKLCIRIPNEAVTWLTGRLALGFQTAPDVKTAAHAMGTAVKVAGKEVYKSIAGIPSDIAGRQGDERAYAAAQQEAIAKFKAEGKTVSPQDIRKETVRTLGEAKWNEIVEATGGAQLAKKIMTITAKEYPKPKSRSKKDPVAGSNDREDFSI
ncbi:MAG: P-type conjugative transfer protein TrbL, partial [Candidatus Omnitrophica bacterium]|nr:P-type conjugative transfer protein TrbL [Candidatus Omnitrophota bacterium]